MNWTNFRTYGLGPEKAFESICNQIFESWVREANKNNVVYFATVRGDGGDGGVEAFVELKDGHYIGLQSKWFPDGLSQQQVGQIEKSVRTAMSVRPQTRIYVVCLPTDLTSLKKVQGDKNAIKTEEARWNGLVDKVKKDFPELELVLWDDHRLTTHLQRPDLEGAAKFWFNKEVITSDLLKQHFAKAKAAWLSERYVPDLHASGHIERAAGFLVRSDEAIAILVGRLSEFLEIVVRLADELSTLQKVLGEEFSASLRNLLDYLRELDLHLRHKLASTRNGSDLEPFEKAEPGDFREYYEQMEVFSKSKARILCDDIKKLLDEFYKADRQRLISQTAVNWNKRFRLFSGDPGTGKTHALANLVESRLPSDQPTIIIQAKSIHDPSSWRSILQSSLGLGGDWSENEILSAFESRAATSEIASRYQPTGGPRASYFLVCVDGLDETQDWDAWKSRVKELEVLTTAYSRLRFLVTGRDYYFEKTELDEVLDKNFMRLPPEGDVPVRRVFDRYISKFQIDISEVPWVKWSIRSLLVLRLFCNQYKGRRLTKSDQISTTIGSLLRDRFALIEKEFLTQIRPKTIGPDKFLFSMRRIAEHFMQKEDIQHDALVSLIRSDLHLEDAYLNAVIDHLKNHGLLVALKKGSAGPLKLGETFYQPSFQPVVEFLIALQVIDLALEGKGVPRHLEHQAGVLRIASTMLFVDHKVLPEENGLWGDTLSKHAISDLRCSALSSAPPETTTPYVDWVKLELKSSMPRSRFVQAKLCYPVCHIPNHPLGPKLVDEVLREFGCAAERDVIWSGIDNVPENHGAVWEGRGPNPIRDENYILSEDEKADGLPLLHAWNLASVDNTVVARCSKSLTLWGTSNPGELAKLLVRLIPSNDPQIEEYLLLVVLGVVSLLRSDQTEYVRVFAEWFLEHVFTDDHLRRYRSSAVRAAGRAVVERACELKLISEDKAKRARPPFKVPFELLPLSKDAAKEKESYGPVWHDLAWYVIKGAYKGFFEHRREVGKAGNRADIWIDEEEVQYLLSEDLGELATEEKQRLEKSLQNKRDQMLQWEADRKKAADGLDGRLNELLTKVTDKDEKDPELKKALDRFRNAGIDIEFVEGSDGSEGGEGKAAPGRLGRADRKVDYEADAQELLSKHAEALGFQITPQQLTLSAICKFAENLGWNEELFKGELNGGKDGEILGADFAITRQHFMASHGSRSKIMAFGEKYVWSAVHYLQGYFSDYIAYSDWDTREPVTDYSQIEDFSNPAQSMQPKFGAGSMIAPCLLSPSEPAIHGDLPAAISIWVKTAVVPDLSEWILPDPEFTKHVSGEKPLCMIHCFNSHTETTGLGDSLLWVHAFLISDSDLKLFESSLRSKNVFIRKLVDDPDSGMTSGVECDCYISPRDVLFMSWKNEIEPTTPLTVVKDGKVAKIQMEKCVCQVTASSTEERERTFYMPTKVVRAGLGITRGDGIRFEDESGNQLAFNVEAGEAFRNSQDNLYVDRERFFEFLNREKKTPLWLVRFDRRQSTKAFHSVGRTDPEITHLRVYYLKDGKLSFFEFDRIER